MEKKISIIVPVYKVEMYLKECIESIINQDYKNLEIILVDDGSPDRCAQICDNYAKVDNRIIVVHKLNGGLSDARNFGLKISSGDYIVFVDSDDFMELDAISNMYKLAQYYDADIVVGGIEKFDDSSKKIIWSTAEDKNFYPMTFTKEEAIKDFFLHGCASWARMYKSSIHKDVTFPVGEINEDEAIVLQLLQKCALVVKTNQIVYHYRFRRESITTTFWNRNKLAWVRHCEDNLKIVKNRFPNLEKYAIARYVSSIIWVLNNASENPKNYKDLIIEYKKKLKEMMRNKNWDFNMDKKEKIRVYLLVYLFFIYSGVVRVFKKHFT